MENTLTFRLERVVQAEVMEDFEGPLDLILFLLGKNKIAICDLQIALLCSQFTAWIEARRELDMEVASEFIEMASYLVYLKSKNLLHSGLEEIDLLKQALEERLASEERQKMEVLRDFLSERSELYRLLMTKAPEPVEPNKEYTYSHTVEILQDALQRLNERLDRRSPPPVSAFTGIVGTEPYPVSSMIRLVHVRLEDTGKIKLDDLFAMAENRSAAVAVFLAVLEMCRNREIDLVEEDEQWSVVKSKRP